MIRWLLKKLKKPSQTWEVMTWPNDDGDKWLKTWATWLRYRDIQPLLYRGPKSQLPVPDWDVGGRGAFMYSPKDRTILIVWYMHTGRYRSKEMAWDHGLPSMADVVELIKADENAAVIARGNYLAGNK